MNSTGPRKSDIAGAKRGRWKLWTCLGFLLLSFVPGVAPAQADSTPDARAIPSAGSSDGIFPGAMLSADEDSIQMRLLEIDAERFCLALQSR